MDRPLKLGATFAGNTTDGFLTFQYDFQPDSMKRVAQGDLLFFGKEQEQVTREDQTSAVLPANAPV